ncbi:MAG: ATP-binding protein [Armatimonadota bacterium]
MSSPAPEPQAPHLGAISFAARAMAAHPEPPEALWTLICALREDLPIDRVGVFLFDPVSRLLDRVVGIDRYGEREDAGDTVDVDRNHGPLARVARGELPYVHSEDAPRDYPASRFQEGVRAVMAIPIIASDELLGVISVDNCLTARPLPASLLDPLFLYAGLAALPLFALYQKRERRRTEEARRAMLGDLLASITGGKILLFSTEELDAEWPGLNEAIYISRAEDVKRVREAVHTTARTAGLPEERAADLGLCASEAATNALLHGNGGAASVEAHDGTIRVRIADRGQGIPLEDLPQATLKAGWSRHREEGKRTLGLGFTLIYKTADRVLLSTGSEGTTVLIEMRAGSEQDEEAELLEWGEAISF